MEVEEEVRDLVEEKEVFREFLRERVRVRDAAQVVSVSPEGTTEVPESNERPVVVEEVVDGGAQIVIWS